MGGPSRPGTSATRPGTAARPGTSGPSEGMLAKTMKMNASRPSTVPTESPYRPVSRAQLMSGGAMQVKENKMFEDLVVGGIAKRRNGQLKPLDTNRLGSGTAKTQEIEGEDTMRRKFLEDRKEKLEAKRAEETASLKRNLRWRLADASANRDAREALRLKQIQEEQDGFVSQVDRLLENKAAQDVLAAKELLHEWDTKVYRKCNSQIARKVEARGVAAVNRRLNDQMDKYVEAVQSKVLFRDIIIESEYNPFESKKAVIKVDMRPRSKTVWDGIKDPLNEQIEKVMEIHEGKALPDTGRDASGLNPGKATLPLNEWATGVIEDTPHGFANKAFQQAIADSNLSFEEKQARAARNVSTLTMEHYKYAIGKAAMDAEYPKGKRCFPGWKAGGSEGAQEEGVGALFKAPEKAAPTGELQPIE